MGLHASGSYLISRINAADGSVSWTHALSLGTTGGNAIVESFLETGASYVFVAGYFSVT